MCREFSMILKINLAANIPSKNWSTILSMNSAYQTWSGAHKWFKSIHQVPSKNFCASLHFFLMWVSNWLAAYCLSVECLDSLHFLSLQDLGLSIMKGVRCASNASWQHQLTRLSHYCRQETVWGFHNRYYGSDSADGKAADSEFRDPGFKSSWCHAVATHRGSRSSSLDCNVWFSFCSFFYSRLCYTTKAFFCDVIVV